MIYNIMSTNSNTIEDTTIEGTVNVDDLTQEFASMTIVDKVKKSKSKSMSAGDIALIKTINDRIATEICFSTINALSDNSLMVEYKETKFNVDLYVYETKNINLNDYGFAN